MSFQKTRTPTLTEDIRLGIREFEFPDLLEGFPVRRQALIARTFAGKTGGRSGSLQTRSSAMPSEVKT
jgi:hypothetical protein